MKRLGIKGTIDAIKSANGPAQHVALSITGLIMAGMFFEMVNVWIVLLWAVSSFLVIFATVWLPKITLQYILITDFFLSMIVCFQYLMYEEPKPMAPIYYSMGANGMSQAARPTMEMSMSHVETAAHVVAVIWLSLWSLYLANLTHRQILERKRLLQE